MKSRKNLFLAGLILGAAALSSGCGVTMTGAVKDDTTLTGTSKQLPTESTVSEYKGPKLRVGVVNFQNRTPSKVLGIGEAASDILGTILQKTERFIVIPQQDIQSILEQQRLGASGAINPDTAAKMGEILGLNAIVTGAVTAYSEAEEGKDLLVYQTKKQIARVTVDYRVVDTTTGVQLLADSGAGIYEKQVSRTLGLGGRAGYDPDLRDGALRDALTKAMVNMMKQLGTRRWAGRVAQVDGNSLYINAGQKSGLNVGDKLDVFRAGKEIIDPVTKMKLGVTENLIGQAIIMKNDIGDQADLSIANPTSGSGFRSGDIVKFSGK
ncbi:MAG: CsgG/HfaB family protein [Deltaproteobacteria bacterium]|nr:CsgG/HfaB family protein [Deltaproteobacteria bacterium]